ncbi:MAG: DUF3298 domain-containing protein [Lachnospiraceae bacterium]|nr:DUF3298 domain-containing protein [Lachnospiraceae bacterium]
MKGAIERQGAFVSKKGIEDLKREYEEIRMSEAQVDAFRQSIERAKKDNRKRSSLRIWKNAGVAVAAALMIFILLPNTSAGVAHAMGQIPLIGSVVKVVTFRDYEYNSETQIADVNVPKLETEELEQSENGIVTADLTDEGSAAWPGNDSGSGVAGQSLPSLKETTAVVNADIDALTDRIVAEFEETVREENSVKEVLVHYEVINTPERYFTLKLMHYEASADGAEMVYYYTVDLTTGERLLLADLFTDGADYITPISEEIIRQMREQMAADDMVAYWIDEEMDDWNFKEITPETQFYVNENGRIVISFNEGDVAPMYMGVVTFEIPEEAVKGIRK